MKCGNINQISLLDSMNYFSNNYCHRKIWICLSFGTIFITFCTLILLSLYRYRSMKIQQNSAGNFNENMWKISNRYRRKRKIDKQIKELIRLTPILPLESMKFHEFNQIKLCHLHSVKTGLAVKPNDIHVR